MKALDRLRERLGHVLGRRSRRERRALAAAAVTIVVALWLQLLWSAHHERQRIARLVGDLRIQNAVMRQSVQAMTEIRAQGRTITPLAVDQGLATLANGLRAHGISTLELLPDSAGQLRLVGEVAFDPWIGWLAAAHAEHGLQVAHATITPTGQPGVVRVEAVVRTARAG